jgi:prolyl-tRNA editing enzyme YbaK/EbsC (Cys-tRNA(Pro) deacylase)
MAILDVLRGITSLRSVGPRTATFTFSLAQALARTPAGLRPALHSAIHTTGNAAVRSYGSVSLDADGRVHSLSVVVAGNRQLERRVPRLLAVDHGCRRTRAGHAPGQFGAPILGAPPGRTAARQRDRHMSDSLPLHPTAARFEQLLHDRGLDVAVRMLPDSARTAPEAAKAIGVEVGQIVKSLVFLRDGQPVLVLCAGDRRVDAACLGLVAARADQVREFTGFAIGGIPPLGHAHPLPTLIDTSFRRFDVVWAAAGHPHAVFPIEVATLIAALPQATVTDV